MAHPGLLDLLARGAGVRRAVKSALDGIAPVQFVGAEGYARLAVAASVSQGDSPRAVFPNLRM